MANPPPPYADITGISRAVMKDNAQANIVAYNGNARPSELVVSQSDQTIYVGNVNGNLNKVIQSSGANVFLGNVRTVSNVSGLLALYFDPATGEVVAYQP
jgi:uncharacterized protein RhaS with RHS repeats